MATTTYCNTPGGVIAAQKDGTSKHYKYGEVVDAGQLADHVDSKPWTDGQKRLADDSPELQAARESHSRAALTENGQVNSSSSPVPGNYSELDEEDAAQLVQNLGNRPESQAAVLIHEKIYGGNRQKVADAAGEYAQKSADLQIKALTKTVTDNTGEAPDYPVAPLPDAESGINRDERAVVVQEAALAGLNEDGPSIGDRQGTGISLHPSEQVHTKTPAPSSTKDDTK